jgi:release factor glutamine methyltransferase
MLRVMSLTLGEALELARRRLPGASALAEAEELVSRIAGLTRTELYLGRGSRLDPEREQRLHQWIDRRLAGEPLQYVTGRAAFRGLDLAVDPHVLIPRPETEGLVEAVLGVLEREAGRWKEPRVLDLGTGSGAIALAIAAEWPAARVSASDASVAALEVARRNARALGLEERIQLLEGDWFEAVPPDERFEVVVANPPYLATGEGAELPVEVVGFEPAAALFAGASGLDALREIVDQAPRHLVADGLLALELAEMRAEVVAGWLEGAHDWGEARLLDDLAGRPRVLLARRAKGPAIAPAQWGEG